MDTVLGGFVAASQRRHAYLLRSTVSRARAGLSGLTDGLVDTEHGRVTRRLRRLLRLLPPALALMACAALVLPAASACCCAGTGSCSTPDAGADDCCGGPEHRDGNEAQPAPIDLPSDGSRCACGCVRADSPPALATATACYSFDLAATAPSVELLSMPCPTRHEAASGGPHGRDPPAETGHRTIVLRF